MPLVFHIAELSEKTNRIRKYIDVGFSVGCWQISVRWQLTVSSRRIKVRVDACLHGWTRIWIDTTAGRRDIRSCWRIRRTRRVLQTHHIFLINFCYLWINLDSENIILAFSLALLRRKGLPVFGGKCSNITLLAALFCWLCRWPDGMNCDPTPHPAIVAEIYYECLHRVICEFLLPLNARSGVQSIGNCSYRNIVSRIWRG